MKYQNILPETDQTNHVCEHCDIATMPYHGLKSMELYDIYLISFCPNCGQIYAKDKKTSKIELVMIV